MKEIEDDTPPSKWKDVLCLSIGRFNVVKMSIMLKTVYRFNVVPIKILVTVLTEPSE